MFEECEMSSRRRFATPAQSLQHECERASRTPIHGHCVPTPTRLITEAARCAAQWVWEMDAGLWQTVLCCYSGALAWMLLVCVARLRAGDSPADVQGGVVVGAIIMQLMLPFAEPLMAWLAVGGMHTMVSFRHARPVPVCSLYRGLHHVWAVCLDQGPH